MSEPRTAPVETVTGWPRLQHAVDETSLWLVFALLGGTGASLLALGLLLRSKQAITARLVAGTVLHSLLWGIVVFLLLVDQARMSVPFMLGVSISSGMGVASLIDLVALTLKNRLGITVTLNPPPKGGKE
jgi:asparagine N-glycosylation enzyme membrane subunit Stt3